MNAQELEKQLIIAKQKEKLERENSEMQQIIEKYVGKCYGSSKFSQKSKKNYHEAVYIHSIERYNEHKFATSKGSIVCNYASITCFKDIDWRNDNNSNYRYCVGHYTTTLNENGYNMFYNINNLIGDLKEIPYNTFYELYNVGESCNQLIENAFSGKTQFKIEKTIGDNIAQTQFEKNCKIADIQLIDLEEHLPLLNAIKYSKIPGFVEDRYLIKNLAKIALECQIKINEEENISIWSNWEKRQNNIQQNLLLKEYIEKLKL